MAKGFQFDHHLDFDPDASAAILRSIPAAPGIFALRGADLPNGSPSEPYLTHATDLRRRLRRLLAPPDAPASADPNTDAPTQPVFSKRLNLRSRVRFVDYTRTGSAFESTLLLYQATRAAFGPEQARRRLRLHPPFFLRLTLSRDHPRVYATNRLSKRSLSEFFGPFPSRAAAERYCDAALDLFQLRRCHEDLQPFPGHPGCVYGEMNKCLQPCKGGAGEGETPNPQACTPAEYAAEAARVAAFFRTRGQSLLDEVAAQREAASEALDFEAAAALHKQWEKVRAASLLADELIRPVPELRAVILQPAAPHELPTAILSSRPETEPRGAQAEPSGAEAEPSGAAAEPSEAAAEKPAASPATNPEPSLDEAAVFLLEAGRLAGPVRLSTLGVRAVREQTAVGSSLFAQPLMLAAIPLEATAPALPLNSAAATPPEHVELADHLEPTDTLSSRPTQTLSSRPEATFFAAAVERPADPPAANSNPLLSPEDRARAVLQRLHQQATAIPAPTIDELCDALSLFRRWYYRPEKQRQGEVFLPAGAPVGSDGSDTSWPIRRILNGAARIVLGPPALAAPVDRDAFKGLKTKIIHPGREGVERTVPVLPKRPRSRKPMTEQNIPE